ncbi:MAG TPA: hypothetical protein VK364_12095, partial [Hymenobacter sp.]|nr:hypothetical protein [Hymenobacter sp.]
EGAGRVRNAHVEVGRVDVALGAKLVATRALRDERGRHVVAGVLHAQGREDALLHHLRVRLAGDLFEDGAEEMSGRLKKRKTEAQDRLEFLETVWYESKRAGLEPSLVAPGSTRAMTGVRDT